MSCILFPHRGQMRGEHSINQLSNQEEQNSQTSRSREQRNYIGDNLLDTHRWLIRAFRSRGTGQHGSRAVQKLSDHDLRSLFM